MTVQEALTLKLTDYVTSDIQLFDEGLVKWRWATSLEHLHARTADDWDATVPDDATVLVVGDCMVGHSEEGLEWFSQRPGKKILITGNWDAVDPVWNSNPLVEVESWLEVFDQIMHRASVRVEDHLFLASHYTYGNVAKNPRLKELKAGFSDSGIPLMHGHTHSRKRVTRSEAGTLQMHVGWDAWKKPVSVQALIDRASTEGW